MAYSINYNIGGKFYDLIKSLFMKSKCSIKFGHQRSAFFDYGNGVRQGCILSQILFNLYLNELSPFLLNQQDTDPILLPNGSTLNCILYSDDLVLISQSADGLRKALCRLFRFCNNWMMNINIKKTKIIICQKKPRKSTTLKHYISNEKNRNHQ